MWDGREWQRCVLLQAYRPSSTHQQALTKVEGAARPGGGGKDAEQEDGVGQLGGVPQRVEGHGQQREQPAGGWGWGTGGWCGQAALKCRVKTTRRRQQQAPMRPQAGCRCNPLRSPATWLHSPDQAAAHVPHWCTAMYTMGCRPGGKRSTMAPNSERRLEVTNCGCFWGGMQSS